MIKKHHILIFPLILSLLFFPAAVVSAHNKVVVIPLMEEARLAPFAPVTADSPPNSAYTIGTTTVTDKVTGLVWQKADDNIAKTWDAARVYCAGNPSPLPGTGWRLASVGELMSIVDYSTYEPAINGSSFPGTNLESYWSATAYVGLSNYAWYIEFGYGSVNTGGASGTNYVRCVRGLPNRQSLFKNNGNGTVTDLATGLTWQQHEGLILPMSNDGPAEAYCQGLSLAGGGWRLPTVKELLSIVDNRVYDPAIDGDVFPNTRTSSYWSATTDAHYSGAAWRVNFYHGYVVSHNKSYTYYVRCVR